MSGYPRKQYSSEAELVKYRIAQKRNHNINNNSHNININNNNINNKPLLTFYYSSYDPSVLPNK